MRLPFRFAAAFVALAVGWTVPAAARPADAVTVTFTNTLATVVEVYLADGPVSDAKGKIEAGQSATYKSAAKAVWKFTRAGEEAEFDQYTATADAEQKYAVHPANPRIAAVMRKVHSPAGLTVILRADTKGQLEGGDRQVLVAEDAGPGSWLRVAPIEKGEKARFRWKLLPAAGGFQLVSTPEGLVVGVARSGELIHQAAGSRDGVTFLFVPTPNGQGLALAPAGRPGTVVCVGKPVIDDGPASARWHPRVEPITKDSRPPAGHTFARGADAGVKYPVLEVEPLPLGADAPARDPSAPRSAEFAAWADAEMGSFRKPSDDEIKEAGSAPVHGTDLVGCARYSRSAYHLIGMDPMNLQVNGLRSRGMPLFKQLNTNISGNYYYAGDNYRYPIDLLVKPDIRSSSDSNTNTYFGSRDVQESFTFNVKVDGNANIPMVGSASVRAGGGNTSTAGRTSSRRTVSVVREKYAHEMWLILNKRRAEMDPQMAELLLDVAVGTLTPDAFFTNYGTHYPLAQLFGGRARETSRLTEESAGTSLSSSLRVSAGASFSGSVAGASVDTSAEETKAVNELLTTSKEKAESYSFGGQGTEFGTWSLGRSDSFVPIKVYLRPIADIVHPELAKQIHDRPGGKTRGATDADALLLHRARAVLAGRASGYLLQQFAQLPPGEESTTVPLEVRVDSITPVTANFGGKYEYPDPIGLTVYAYYKAAAKSDDGLGILHLRNKPGQRYQVKTSFKPSVIEGGKPDDKFVELNGSKYRISPGVFRFLSKDFNENSRSTLAVGAHGTAGVPNQYGNESYVILHSPKTFIPEGYGDQTLAVSDLVKAPDMHVHRKLSFYTVSTRFDNHFKIDVEVTFQKARLGQSPVGLPSLEALEGPRK